jgi:hypothetical protein
VAGVFGVAGVVGEESAAPSAGATCSGVNGCAGGFGAGLGGFAVSSFGSSGTVPLVTTSVPSRATLRARPVEPSSFRPRG